jgi:isopenicillin-N epimerase
LEENNWKEKSNACRKIVIDNYQRFCDLVGTEPICPISEEFLGQMASIPIRTEKPMELKELLYSKYKIQIPIMPLNGKVYMRYSINAYNSQEDLDVLYQAITDIMDTTDLIVRYDL